MNSKKCFMQGLNTAQKIKFSIKDFFSKFDDGFGHIY